jgi:alkylation response protein AidB-like acyl-CoA dehydrogenase
MDLGYTDEENLFRHEVREFFRTAIPADIQRKTVLGQKLARDDVVRWMRILHEKGWATPGWPVEWGGTGWDPIRQYIFREELLMAPAPEALVFNANMIGPLLAAFGTQEQKQHFLPRIASLEYWFCRASPNPIQDRTLHRCGPARCVTETTMLSPVRRSGRHSRTMPIGASSWSGLIRTRKSSAESRCC